MNYLKKKFKKFSPIYNSIEKNRILRDNLTKEVKVKYTENYKTLMREIEHRSIFV